MQELEKILKEIENEALHNPDVGRKQCEGMVRAMNIIRKHMNDGWILIGHELPPTGQRLLATIKHHEWVSDYDTKWIPKEEKIKHEEYTDVCEITSAPGESETIWFYSGETDDYQKDYAYINPEKNLSRPVAEIIAWQPLPAPYKERGYTNDPPHTCDTCRRYGKSDHNCYYCRRKERPDLWKIKEKAHK